jgi:hypothetical protein
MLFWIVFKHSASFSVVTGIAFLWQWPLTNQSYCEYVWFPWRPEGVSREGLCTVSPSPSFGPSTFTVPHPLTTALTECLCVPVVAIKS